MRSASTWMPEKVTQTPSPSPDLIPAKNLTRNSHFDWYGKRGHFRMTSKDKNQDMDEILTPGSVELHNLKIACRRVSGGRLATRWSFRGRP